MQDEDIDLQYYQGYVHHPIFTGLRYYDPFLQSAADLSHNLANFCKVSTMLNPNPDPNLDPNPTLENPTTDNV